MPVDLFAEYNRWTVLTGGTTGPVAGTSETWTVTSSVGAPAASNSASPPTQFRVVDAADTNVPPEIMIVTNVAGTTWTATRGAESGAVWAHASGWTAIPVLSARVMPQLTGIQTLIINTSQSVTVPAWASFAEIVLVAGGGAGSGGGSAAPTGGVTNQAGGSGGGSGGELMVIAPVTAGASLTVTIGAGGAGGAGAAVGSGSTGNAGTIGGGGANTTITGGGLNYAAIGGGQGRAGAANSASAPGAGVKGSAWNGANATILYGPGTGGTGGGTVPTGGGTGLYTAGGGAGGVAATATLGGAAGAPGVFSTQAQVSGNTATANGANAVNAANNTGAGGGGGGGGAPGGTGGNGGNGGSGFAYITWRAA